MEYKYIVYITINLCNGKFYIGVHKTIDPNIFDNYIGNGIYSDSDARYLQKKLSTKGKKVPFVTAVVKYGYKNFKRTVIKVFNTEQEAYNFEKELVNETLLKSKQCYNVAIGGKIAHNIIETKVYKFALNGNYLRSYKSVQEAADDVHVDQANIFAVLRGDQLQSGGFYWNTEKKFNMRNQRVKKPVAQYTLNNTLLNVFDSITEAANTFHTTTSAICRAIKTNGTASKYKWAYFKEKDDDIV